MRQRVLRRCSVAVVVGLIALMGVAAPAGAALTTVTVAGGVLTVTSDAADAITVTCATGNVKVNGADPTTGTASCPSITSMVITGGPGANTIDLSGVVTTAGNFSALATVTVNAGDGGDTVTGSSIGDVLNGQAAADTISGGPGNDTITGGTGADTVNGGDGNDTLISEFRQPRTDQQTNLPDDFAFDKDDGSDIITDFDPTCPACTSLAGFPPPGDKIVLLGGTAADIEQVVKDVTILKGGDAELRYGDTFITLEGFLALDVTADMFAIG